MFVKRSFIEKSLIDLLAFLKAGLYADEYALAQGLMQSLDPRVKTITTVLCIVLVLLAKNIVVIFCLYLFCIFLAFFSKIRLGFFLKRCWIFVPFFSLLIALPAIFSQISPGVSLFTFKVAQTTFVVTRQGLSNAGLFILRVTTSVSFVILLSLTTRHSELLKVLRLTGIPQVFILVLGMGYRYIYLFVEIVEHTYAAIKSRVGFLRYERDGRQIVAWNIAALWVRAFKLNQDVYLAMLSRGYQGEGLAWNDFKMRARDWVWLVGVILLGAVTTLCFGKRMWII